MQAGGRWRTNSILPLRLSSDTHPSYLRLDKNLEFDEDWVKEMRLVSEGLADEDYCHKLQKEAGITAHYLEDQGVKFIHHDEKNVLLEFKTDQHFVFPEGGGKAIIWKLFEKIHSYDNCDIHWETEATRLIMDEAGAVQGLKVRKGDGRLHNLNAPNVVLACGGFEGNREMLARYVGPNTHKLPLIAPGLKYNRGAGLQMALEVGAGTAGSFDGMHCELVDTRATKPDAVMWGHNYGYVCTPDHNILHADHILATAS